MRIGFIGIGQVGGALAKKLGSKSHSIYLGTRKQNDEKANLLQSQIGAHATIVSTQGAIQKSEVVVLSTPWSAVEDVVAQYRDELRGKVVIDCTNPLMPNLGGLILSGDDSGGERVQRLLPNSHVIKAFNTVGFNIMENPKFGDRNAMMYFCGNSENARHIVKGLIEEVGFLPIDAGGIESARLLEPLALLWISTAYKFGQGREFAYSILKRS